MNTSWVNPRTHDEMDKKMLVIFGFKLKDGNKCTIKMKKMNLINP